MSEVMFFKKKTIQPMYPWKPKTNMNGVSVSQADKDNGSPKLGDMIAYNPDDLNDKWLVAEAFILDNYQLLSPMELLKMPLKVALSAGEFNE